MKKSLVLATLATGFFATSALAEVKTLNFSIANLSGLPFELTLSSVLKYDDKVGAGCKVKSKDQLIMCRTNKDGIFDTSVVATFVFQKLGEGPTLVINEEGFTVRNNTTNNLATKDAKMDTEGKWPSTEKTVTITFPKN